MANSYLFDGRSLGALLVSGALAGGLLFLAGIVVGYHWSGAKLAAAPASVPASRVAGEAADLQAPTLGSVPKPPPAPQVLARWRLPHLPAHPGAAPDVAGSPPEVAAAGGSATEGAALDLASEAPAAGEPAPEVAEAPPEPRPEFVLPPLPPPPPAFSLQVGAFLQAENLERFLADLTERGYTPRVVQLTSSSGQVLSVVRVGGFAERSEATQAALTFQQREGLDAFVRPEARG